MSNLSEEEKKAIEEVKKQIKEVHNLNNINIFVTDSSTLKILLHLIDRLQKENEELKEYYSKTNLEKITKEIFNKTLKDYVSKDKIKKMLKRFENTECNSMQTILMKALVIEALEDLLKE